MNSARFASSRRMMIVVMGIIIALVAMLFAGCTPSNSSSNSAKSMSATSSKAADPSSSSAKEESTTEWLQESGESASKTSDSAAPAETQEPSSAAAPASEERSSQSNTTPGDSAAEQQGTGKAPGTRSDENTYILRDANGKDTVRIYAIAGYDYFDTLSEGHKYVWEKSHDDSLGGLCITLLYTEETMDEYFEAMDKFSNEGGSANVTVGTARNGNIEITWHKVLEEGGKEVGYYAWVTDGKHNVTVEYANPNPLDAPDHMTEELYVSALMSIEFI